MKRGWPYENNIRHHDSTHGLRLSFRKRCQPVHEGENHEFLWWTALRKPWWCIWKGKLFTNWAEVLKIFWEEGVHYKSFDRQWLIEGLRLRSIFSTHPRRSCAIYNPPESRKQSSRSVEEARDMVKKFDFVIIQKRRFQDQEIRIESNGR